MIMMFMPMLLGFSFAYLLRQHSTFYMLQSNLRSMDDAASAPPDQAKAETKMKMKRNASASVSGHHIKEAVQAFSEAYPEALSSSSSSATKTIRHGTPKTSAKRKRITSYRKGRGVLRNEDALAMGTKAIRRRPTVTRVGGGATKKKNKHAPVKVKHRAPNELLLPKPIIDVGFPKAGTSTIFSFFHCNGLRAQHWYCCDVQRISSSTPRLRLMSRCMLNNMAKHRPPLQDCGDFDVYSEINGPRNFKDNDHKTMLDDGTLLSDRDSDKSERRIFFPQHHQLDTLHQHYPNATLILNQRNVDAWVDSVCNWGDTLRYQIVHEFYHQNSTRFLFDDEGLSNTTTTTTTTRTISPRFTASDVRRFLKIIYNYHLDYVRNWVANHPGHALVEVDIGDENAGTILAESFGLHEDCWGHFNQNQKNPTPEKRKR
jgi:predicted Zn-dependent protease